MKKIFVIIFCCLILISCKKSSNTEQNNNTDWSISRGNSSLSGYTEAELPDNPKLLWTYKSDARTASSPLVYGGMVYWCDKRGKVYGLNDKGELCFDYNFNTAVEATPMIHDSVLYIGRIDGFMSALSLIKRDTLWSFETMGQISASPNVVRFEQGNAIIFGSYDNFLYCIDSKTGKKIKQFESGYYINGAVAVANEYLIYGGCDAWVRIINKDNGIQTDSLKLDAYVPASPAVWDNYCYVGDYSGDVYELRLDNEGKIAESKKIMESSNENSSYVSVPAVTKKTVFILSDERYLYAINREDKSIQWKFLQKGDTSESSPVICDDKVLVCSKSGIVSILDAKEGELLWEYDTGEQITASPAVVDGRFYILTAKGTLFCFGK